MSSAVTFSDQVEIVFMPRLGDIVEFLSDRQTEKGPSSGEVVAVDYKKNTCRIRHSDTEEAFYCPTVRVRSYTRHRNHADRKPYWGLV
jgi:hypothetical protein